MPAAALVSEPMHRTTPTMSEGDVFNTQFELTNHGLIRAIDLNVRVPEEDQYFRYELLAEIPPQLEAQESLVVPYRMVAKQQFPPTSEGAGGCFSYRTSFNCPYGYICPDGTEDDGSAAHFLSKLLGDSCGSQSSPSTGSGGSDGGGTWSGGGSSGSGTSIGGTTCAPDCVGDECCDATKDGG